MLTHILQKDIKYAKHSMNDVFSRVIKPNDSYSFRIKTAQNSCFTVENENFEHEQKQRT